MAEVRVTKTGAYAEIDGVVLQITKTGVYAEIGIESVRVTAVGVYAEISSQAVNVTAVGVYVELASAVVLASNDDIVPVIPNLHLYYAGATINRFVRSFSLTAEVSAPDTTDMSRTDNSSAATPTIPAWKADLGGLWEPGLDNIFGAEVTSRGLSGLLYSFEAVIGWLGAQSQYVWPGRAWVARYQVITNADEALSWEATIICNGTPERNSLGVSSA